MMVVIPTSTDVNMHYGWNMIDYVAYLLSFAGIAWIVVTRRRSKQTAE
jgi:predicted MFS family arabinose efflux permease